MGDAGSITSLSMQGPLSSNNQSAVSHLAGYPDAVGVGLFAIQPTVVYGHFNLSLLYVLIRSLNWNSRLLEACEEGSILGKLS